MISNEEFFAGIIAEFLNENCIEFEDYCEAHGIDADASEVMDWIEAFSNRK